jgi:hypothetical protein
MNSLRRTLREVMAGLANEAAKEPRTVPSHRFDGEEIKSAQDIAVALSIPVIEAKARIRRVRTPEGARTYNQPIGSIITRDLVTFDAKLPTAQWKLSGDNRNLWRGESDDGWTATAYHTFGPDGKQAWRLRATHANRNLSLSVSWHKDLFEAREHFDRLREENKPYEARRVIPESKKRFVDTKDEYWGVYGKDWSYGDEAEQALPEWEEDDRIVRQAWALKEVRDMGIEWEGPELNPAFFEVANRVMQHHEAQYPGFSATVTKLGTTFNSPHAFAHNQLEFGKEVTDADRGLWRRDVYAPKTTGLMWNAKMFAGRADGAEMRASLMATGQEGSGYKSHRTKMLREQFPDYDDAQVGFIRTTVHELGHTVMRMILGDLQSYQEGQDTENRDYYREMFWYHAAEVMQNHGAGDANEIYDAMVTNRGSDQAVTLDTGKMRDLLSAYGGTNLHEMAAEIWAEYQLDPEPRQFAAEMGSLMEKVLDEWLFWNVLEEDPDAPAEGEGN